MAFVGSDGRGYHEAEWPYRRELVSELVEMCARNGWTFKNPGGSDPKVDRGEELNDFYASAKVTVRDSLCPKHEASRYWSDRVPEATARGGLLVTPQIDILSSVYAEALPMYPWGDWQGLEQTIGRLLSDQGERQRINELTTRVGQTATYVTAVETLLATISGQA